MKRLISILIMFCLFLPAAKTGNPYVLNNAKQFQKELSGDANLSFEMNGVSFDGIDDAGKLIDRKFGHGGIFNETIDEFGEVSIVVSNPVRETALLNQIERQLKAVGNDGSKIKWEISTELGTKGIKEIFNNPRIVEQAKYKGIENVTVAFKQQQKFIY